MGLIPAAGEGKRMRPLSLYRPKFLLPIMDRPLVSFSINDMLKGGVNQQMICVKDDWALFWTRKLICAENEWLEINKNATLSIDSLIYSIQLHINADFLAVYLPDIYLHKKGENTLHGMVETMANSDADMVVGVTRAPPSTFKEHLRVNVEADGRITDIGMVWHDEPNFQRTGRFLIKVRSAKKLLTGLGGLNGGERVLLKLTSLMIKKGFRVQAYLMESITNINTPLDLLKVNLQELRNRKLKFYIGSANIVNSTIINSVVCSGAKIESSLLESSLVLSDSTLTGRKVSQAIIFGDNMHFDCSKLT